MGGKSGNKKMEMVRNGQGDGLPDKLPVSDRLPDKYPENGKMSGKRPTSFPDKYRENRKRSGKSVNGDGERGRRAADGLWHGGARAAARRRADAPLRLHLAAADDSRRRPSTQKFHGLHLDRGSLARRPSHDDHAKEARTSARPSGANTPGTMPSYSSLGAVRTGKEFRGGNKLLMVLV
ncbi:unnamed protein product [Miscanthus lutarioriparius]|uniref:Uncharacterized protein n=1 Tax=Miscanthus lutarioriparius TaxID=422564 RepID=A0A811RZP9_9POAL|nr:unnamed protein product [Miscanthus lutarioriparius]